MLDTIVVGAGISGLMAAREITRAGYTVLVMDKGRGPGGRMSTRRTETATFDHGAQYFTVRTPGFERVVQGWVGAGDASEWTRGFQGRPGGHPRYRGTPGMSAIPKSVARGLDVACSQKVVRVTAEGGAWKVEAESGREDYARSLVLTPPVPQVLALLDDSGTGLPPGVRASLERVEYAPCFTLMVELDGLAELPPHGGLMVDPPSPVAWIADNARKGVPGPGGTPQERSALTVNAGPGYSLRHRDDDREKVAGQLLDAVRPVLGTCTVVRTQVHRWLYALPTTLAELDEPFAVGCADPPLVVAGDALCAPRVEGAVNSGLAAGRYIVGRMAGA